jgi:hypothetical protein
MTTAKVDEPQMPTLPPDPEMDELAEFDAPQPAMTDAEVASVQGRDEGQGISVKLDFPAGTDPKQVDGIMKSVAKKTAEMAQSESLMDIQHKKYQAEGHRRWKCRINSMRSGLNHFEVTVEHPKNGRPIAIKGYCGVIIEQGLPKFAINCLRYDHSFRTEEIPIADPTASMGLISRTIREPHYSVEVFEEVQNPAPIGSIGREHQDPSIRLPRA